MSLRARPLLPALAAVALAGCAQAGCAQGSEPVAITAEPAPEVAPPERMGETATAKTFTFEYAPLQFKVAVAVPEGGRFCIILPEGAQDETGCFGLDPDAMVEALPKGPEKPFGVGYARMEGWSYIVMLAPIGTGIEAREDIEEFLAGAVKPDPSAPGVAPAIVPPSGDAKYEVLSVVKGVPIVKFRIDTPAPEGSAEYDVSSTLHYAAFGAKTAMVSFVTAPRDMEKLMPYADASVASLALPARAAPESFGKPRSEISQGGFRNAIVVLGPLIAVGALLFLWLARGNKKSEPAK